MNWSPSRPLSPRGKRQPSARTDPGLRQLDATQAQVLRYARDAQGGDAYSSRRSSVVPGERMGTTEGTLGTCAVRHKSTAASLAASFSRALFRRVYAGVQSQTSPRPAHLGMRATALRSLGVEMLPASAEVDGDDRDLAPAVDAWG